MLILSVEHAQYVAAKKYTTRPLTQGKITHRQEPDWKRKDTLTGLLNHVGASNLPTVTTALTHPGRVLLDLTTMRNFYGHRGENTAKKATNLAKNYSIANITHPTQLCLSKSPGRPVTILEDWQSEILSIADFATR